MFAYCNNNPSSYQDAEGMRCVHTSSRLYCGGTTGNNLSPTQITVTGVEDSTHNGFLDWLGNLDIAISNGFYVSINVGAFNINGNIDLAMDSEGNVQLFGSVSFDVTSAGSLSISGGNTSSLFFVPDVSYLQGGTNYAGGSVAVPIPKTPISAVGSLNIGQTTDGYWGGTLGTGVGPAVSKIGGEVHGGHSDTWALTPSINLFDLFS